MNISQLAAACALTAVVTAPLVVRAETLSGTVVDLATYVTRDHNMDAMHGSMGGAMHEPKAGAMHEAGMAHHACPATLGLVSNGGVGVYLLVTQMESRTAQALCAKLDKTALIAGTRYEKGGMHALLVTSVR